MFAICLLCALGSGVLLARWLLGDKELRLPPYIKGPRPASWLLGNQVELVKSEAGEANRSWRKKYGYVYKYRGCFGVEYLMLNDANAIRHVLQEQTITYGLEEPLRQFLWLVAGGGLFCAKGFEHAEQRRVLLPALKSTFVKSLAPTFASSVSKLVNEWSRRLETEGKDGIWDVNAFPWIKLLAADSFGASFLGPQFATLEGEEHELMKAHDGLLSGTFCPPTIIGILLLNLLLIIPCSLIKYCQYLPLAAMRKLKQVKDTRCRLATELIKKKRKQLDDNPDIKARDLLTIFVNLGEQNETTTLPPMSDEMICDQITTFIMAGFESTANTVSFALYEVARFPAIQERLYNELISVLGTASTQDLSQSFHAKLLDDLPYLTAVINETLRMHSAANYGLFKATKGDAIPLSVPIETTDHQTITSIPVMAGQRVVLSFDGFNRSEVVWGKDANEFRPERWLANSVSEVPDQHQCGGVYGNLASFGGGPSGCIGWFYAYVSITTNA
ncbi:cytochrome P450 [Calocera cornea HHB12733]|uniref:Cytochrome P450 n=1 Tax=Calocera cornea HHB12733 TaxID=1353952 RepID=A0A165EHC0_9BASI|nr:cytochrome P450 [Calocera cornea HHB12733]